MLGHVNHAACGNIVFFPRLVLNQITALYIFYKTLYEVVYM